jgi:flagellin
VDLYDIGSYTGATAAVSAIQNQIQNLANIRANNGAEQSRLTFAADMLSINKVNLESANSRILDLDVADESTKLARFNILQQAGTAMLAQANQSTQSILRLLVG